MVSAILARRLEDCQCHHVRYHAGGLCMGSVLNSRVGENMSANIDAFGGLTQCCGALLLGQRHHVMQYNVK